MSKKTLSALLTILIVLIVALLAFVGWQKFQKPTDQDQAQDQPGEEQTAKVKVANIFDNKIVYEMDDKLGVQAYIDDCAERGGEFKECGSACADSAEFCVEVCAYTCRFEKEKQEQNNFGEIRFENLSKGGVISSPATLRGQARSDWFLDKKIPVVLTDWDGLIIDEAKAMAQSEIVPGEFIDFEVVLEYEKPELKNNGSLIFHKPTPAGMPDTGQAVEIPVIFE